MKKSIKSVLRQILSLASFAFIVSTIASTLISCSDEPSTSKKGDCVSRSIEITPSEREVSVRSNEFAWNLLQQCMETEGKGHNVVVSPMSANICLAMLANGTAGESRAQILQALGFSENDMEEVNSLNRKLARQICGLDDNITLSLANSFWYNEKINPKTVFLTDLYNFYEIQSFTINPSTFASDVNKWCYEQTKGLVPKIIDNNSVADFAFLNALYFKGFWSEDYRFKKEATRRDDFFNSDGSKSKVEYMVKERVYSYHCDELWRAIRIPFSGGGFNLTIILPNDDSTIEECMSSIKDFAPPTAEFTSRELKVKLPKIRLKNSQDLCQVLRKMGISDIFDVDKADFSNMTDGNMVVDLTKQNVSFELDEDGAEAAAVTIVEGIATAFPNDSPHFFIDHPFIFMISEKSTGAILFMGRINQL